LIAAQDSEINRLTSEKANEQLVDAIKETSKRLGVHLVKNDEEIHQMISDWKYKNISEFVQDLLPSKIMTEKETKPPEAPKEAPKEGEK
jgi:glycine cleavage system pyridoxal-binding protein P